MRRSNGTQKKKNWTLQYIHTKDKWKEYERRKMEVWTIG